MTKGVLAFKLVVISLASLTFGVLRTADDRVRMGHFTSPLNIAFNEKTPCLTEEDISSSMHILATGDQQESDQARKLLLSKSVSSAYCRQEIIAGIESAMDKPMPVGNDHVEFFSTWQTGAQLFGELKAVEALDMLIARLDLSDGMYSASMKDISGVYRVLRIGPSAIPKLTGALRQNEDRLKRFYAVYCLVEISQSSEDKKNTVQTFKQALWEETDPCVNHFIQVALAELEKNSDEIDEANSLNKANSAAEADFHKVFMAGCEADRN